MNEKIFIANLTILGSIKDIKSSDVVHTWYDLSLPERGLNIEVHISENKVRRVVFNNNITGGSINRGKDNRRNISFQSAIEHIDKVIKSYDL